MKLKYKQNTGIAHYKKGDKWVRLKVKKDDVIDVDEKTAEHYLKSSDLWEKAGSEKSEKKSTKKTKEEDDLNGDI